MDETCAVPEFQWLDHIGVWSECVHCGRFAWDHEQADVLTDLRNLMDMARSGRSGQDYPPAMR